MATTEPRATSAGSLQETARRHLWLHFSRMGAYSDDAEIPIIVRGEGCYLWDEHGNRYFDGLSALFCSNIGHGRQEVGQAGADQAGELEFVTNWSYAHPQAITLAARIADLAPGRPQPRLLHERRQRGGRVRDQAVAPVPQAQRQAAEDEDHRARHRLPRHDARRALRDRHHLAAPAVRAADARRLPRARTRTCTASRATIRWSSPRRSAERIEFEGPDTVAAVILEPVQNAGGCFTPPEGYFARVREICDEYDVLLISDEVICSWGRLGAYFGAERLGYRPDLITTAKGITSAYAPMGALIASDRIAEPFMHGHESFLHGYTFAGHPVACAIAHANLDVFENEGILDHVRANEGVFADMLESLRDIPIVGDTRGMGYFRAIELVKDRETKASFDDDESEWLLRGFLSGELYRRGLICRADDRGDPVIQLAPPLITTAEQFGEIHDILRPVLEEASSRLGLV